MKPAFAMTLAVGVLLTASAATAHAQRSHIGPHAGYNFDVDRALIGAQMLLPVGMSRLTQSSKIAGPGFSAARPRRPDTNRRKTMSQTASTLLLRNLHDVFGEIDPVRRRAAIDEIFHEDAMFYEPNGVYRGRDEIDRIAGVIKATHPDFQYQPLSPPEEMGDGCRVRWVSGSPGKPPAYAGTDFIIVRDGKIAAVYLFFDKLPELRRRGGECPLWDHTGSAVIKLSVRFTPKAGIAPLMSTRPTGISPAATGRTQHRPRR